jgi:hypothetical protein
MIAIMLHRFLAILYTAIIVCILLSILVGFVIIFAHCPKLAFIVIISILAVLIGSAIGEIHADEDEHQEPS